MAAFDSFESKERASSPESSTFAMAAELFKPLPDIMKGGGDANVDSMIGTVAIASAGSSTGIWSGGDVPASAAKNFAVNIQPMRMEA